MKIAKTMTFVRIGVLSGLLACAFAAHGKDFNVKDYGAKGDGATSDTGAIQKAIDAAAKGGGGRVVVPAGTYLSGSLFVKSHVELALTSGSTILGSQNITDYPMMPTRVAGIEMTWPAALVNVYAQTDAKITGKGSIDGNGKIFWQSFWTTRARYEPKGLRWAADYDAKRPRLIQIFKSSKVELSGLALKRSGFWTVDICYSQNVTVAGITINNNIDGKGPSTDGIDIDSSRHILVEHTDITVNDDALCLKAGRDSDGLRVNHPTEDVVLRDSVVRAGAAGVTIGSETSGGFRNIEAYRIKVLAPVPNGILFKSARTRGGWTDGIRIHDIDLVNVPVVIHVTLNWNPSYSYATLPDGMTNVPDYWKVLTTPVSEQRGLAHFRNVWLSSIHATGAKKAFEVSAYPNAPLENFHLSAIQIEAQTAGMIANAANWTLTNVHVKTLDGTRIQFKDDSAIKCTNSSCE
ncbi:MAG TPA: glycosyl hydrolase family 28 protein [Acidobacteriaceae bacterium]|jgi:polygalacturonase